MEKARPSRPRRPLRRALRWVFGTGVVLVLLVALLGPTLAGAIAPAVASGINLPGSIEVQRVKLTWIGRLEIEHASLLDTDGSTIASVSMRTGGGLLGLLDGHIEQDIVIDGWAKVTTDEQGTTNLERALGLSRDPGKRAPDAPPSKATLTLPFSRIVLDGLDLVFTQHGTNPIAIAQLKGYAQANGAQLTVEAQGQLVSLTKPMPERADIARAQSQGQWHVTARFDINTLTGSAEFGIDSLTVDAARALAALTGSTEAIESAGVSALGGLELDLSAKMQDGEPHGGTLRIRSQALKANLELASQQGVLTLAEPARFEVNAAAFLENKTVREIILPTPGVAVRQAGIVTLTIDRLAIPMRGAVPDVRNASGHAQVHAGRTLLDVPGSEGTTVQVRASELLASVTKDAGTPTLAIEVGLRAGVQGRPDGTLTLNAQANLPEPQATTDGALSLATLTALLPSAMLQIESMPTLSAKPWLATLDAMGLDIPLIVGNTADATIQWTADTQGSARVSMRANTPHVRAAAAAIWSEQAVELTEPLTLAVARPGDAVRPWLPEGWVLDNGRGLQLEAQALRIPMRGLEPQLRDAQASADIRGSQLRLRTPDQPDIELPELHLALQAQGDAGTLRLTASPTIDAIAANLNANLHVAGLQSIASGQWPAVLGEVELVAPTQLAAVLNTTFADRPIEQWARDAIGPQASINLTLTQPQADQRLAGNLVFNSLHANMHSTELSANEQGFTMHGAVIEVRPNDTLWQALAPPANFSGTTLRTAGPLRVQIGPASWTMQGQPFDLADFLESTTVHATLPKPWTLEGAPLGPGEEPERADLTIQSLSASLNSLGRLIANTQGVSATLDLRLDAGTHGPLATLHAQATSNDPQRLEATILVDQLNPSLAIALAGGTPAAREALDGAAGDAAQIELQARVDRDASGSYTPRTASLHLRSPRLKTIDPIQVGFDTETIALTEPAAIEWLPNEHWLESAIGARVIAEQPFRINLERVQVGNALEGKPPLPPQETWLNASFVAESAVVSIPDRPDIELHTIEATHRRVGPGRFATTAKAKSANGSVELNGLLVEPTDAQGRFDFQNASFRGTIRGDNVPVAVADAMSNSDGLLAELIGDVVDLDVEISDARLIPGTPPSGNVRFSVRGPRAQASAYGRLENHVINMPEPQTILTIREVRPEVATRFAEIIPDLLQVEKRPEDGPAIVRTQSLSIPTDGQWGHANGSITIALGTARFRSTSLLSGILKATGQREQGSLGRRIEPIEIGIAQGLFTYKPFDLPLGDLTLHSEGSVNLVENTMDVIIWIPMAALSDEAAGRFNTGLGSAIGRSIPGFSALTTVPWRVSGSLDGPSIRPAPNVLIERRGDQILGPLLRPGETLSDLLSLPRRRQEPRNGG